MSEKKPTIYGTWANLRREYMHKHDKGFLDQLNNMEGLDAYLDGYQQSYQLKASKMADALAAEHGVDDNLLRHDPYAWILKTAQIQEKVRESIQKDVQS